GIELSVPGQLTTRFAKLTKEGRFDLTSLDKQIAPSEKKSETKKSIPVEDLTQESVRKRVRQASVKCKKEESHQQGSFGEVLRTYKLQEAARAATISKQKLHTGTPRTFYGTSLIRPPIARQSLSAKRISTLTTSGSLDPDIVIETSTSSEKVLKIPATPKAKEAVSFIVTATPEKRAVQVQQKEDPYKNFVEVEAPAHIFITENQYCAKDTTMGQYMVLNRKTPRSIITEPVSTVVAATVTESAKTSSRADKSFGSLTKDQWEPDESIIEKLAHDVSNLLYQYGVEDRRYRNKVKELEWAKKVDKTYQANLQAVKDQAAKQARDQAAIQAKDQDAGQATEQDDKQAENPDNTQMQDEDEQ
ncbi:MAG: hypothetical protein GY861_16080, partial [bacterium]|nr:hypothetical protein [bacterium]